MGISTVALGASTALSTNASRAIRRTILVFQTAPNPSRLLIQMTDRADSRGAGWRHESPPTNCDLAICPLT